MLSQSQRQVYRFLRSRAQDEAEFAAADVERVAGWAPGSFQTYKTKQLKDFLVRGSANTLIVKPQFLRLSEDDFRDLVTQSRTSVARFRRTVFEALLRYEFLLPLTNERKLTAALDELFFRDHLIQRAVELGVERLAEVLPLGSGEAKDAYYDRVATRVGSLLGGYSIGHVHGRFRAGGLRTLSEAATVLAERGRYLVDETTAVVRFILPLARSRADHGDRFDVGTAHVELDEALRLEADTARRLFIMFFVESVILNIHGEDEIWFLEASPFGERLYVLEKEVPKPKPQAPAGAKEQLDLITANPLDVWLRGSGYEDIANRIVAIVDDWKSRDLKTRRNWWDVLAGDGKGKPIKVAGETFPILASLRARKGFAPVASALQKPTERPIPA